MGRPRKNPDALPAEQSAREQREIVKLRSELSWIKDENANLSSQLFTTKAQLGMLERDLARFKTLIETQNAQTQSVVELRAMYNDAMTTLKNENAQLKKDLAALGSRRGGERAISAKSDEESDN